MGAKLAAGLLAGLVVRRRRRGARLRGRRADPRRPRHHIALDGGQIAQLLLGTLLTTALWGGIGVGLGTIVRNHVAAVIALLSWVFVIDSLLFALVPSVGRLLPTAATNAVLGETDSHLVPAAAGAALLVAWVAGLVGIGAALTARRDVG